MRERIRHLLATAGAMTGLLLALAPGASASVPCPGDDRPPSVGPETVFAMFCDINVIRGRNNLPPLRWDWHLWTAAQGMAADMARNQYFSHVEPDGRRLYDRVLASAYSAGAPDWVALENIAWGSGPSASPLAISLGWLNSEGHRTNMLAPDMTDVAVGLAEGATTPGGDDGFFYVVDFGHPGTEPEQAAPAPSVARKARVHRRGSHRRRGKIHRVAHSRRR